MTLIIVSWSTKIKKGVIYTPGEKSINLSDDPLTNIHIMVPLMNDEQKKVISYVMFGFFLGAEVFEKKEK